MKNYNILTNGISFDSRIFSAINKKESRDYLLHPFYSKENREIVATDGHVMLIQKVLPSKHNENSFVSFESTVPFDIISDEEKNFTGKKIKDDFFKGKKTELFNFVLVPEMEIGCFPDYKRVVPEKLDKNKIGNLQQFKDDGARLFNKNDVVILHDGSFKITARRFKKGFFVLNSHEIAFDFLVFEKAYKFFDFPDDAEVYFTTGSEPLLIVSEKENKTAVIMPVFFTYEEEYVVLNGKTAEIVKREDVFKKQKENPVFTKSGAKYCACSNKDPSITADVDFERKENTSMEKSKQIVLKNNDAAILPASLSSGFIPSVASRLGYDETELTKRAVEFYNFCRIRDLSAENDAKKAEWLAQKEGKPFKAPKLLKDCTPESTQKAFLQVAAWNIPLDSRDFCYFYNNNGNMTAEPSYKGLLYVASQNGLEVDAGLVFDGDSFEMTESAAGDSFVLKRGNPFGRKKIVGFYAFVKCARYSPKIYTFSFEELEAAKQASVRKMGGKESPAWKFFPNDMYLKVGLKKALKISMAKIEIRSEIRAMFDDEVPEAEDAVQVQSEKTALFASTMPVEALTATPIPETPSIETDGQENGQSVDVSDEEMEISEENAEPAAVILELSAFLEKVEAYADDSLSLDDADTLKKMKYVNDLRDRLVTSGYADAAKQASDAFNKKLRKGVK